MGETRRLRPRSNPPANVGRLSRSPLPARLRAEAIELLSDLLLAEVMRHPEAYLRAEASDPDGGTTVTRRPA